MTLEQFKSLAQAYGADLNQWPEEYQSEASLLTKMYFKEICEILNEEAALDELLTSHTIVPASHALFASVVASAPQSEFELWQLLEDWLDYCLAHIWRVIGIAFTSAVAGAFCVSLLASGMLPQNGESTNATAEYVDFGNDWIAL